VHFLYHRDVNEGLKKEIDEAVVDEAVAKRDFHHPQECL
jgi:hypothetical protein